VSERVGERAGIRQFIAGLLALSLVFGLGYALGLNEGTGPVDQALEEIVSIDPEGASLESLRQAAIEGALKASGDEWSNYFPESTMDVFNERLFNEYTGLGLWLRKAVTGGIEIASVQPNSPAEAEGVKAGDRLLAINENSVDGVTLPAVLAIVRGAEGKTVDLLIDRNGRESLVSVEKVTMGRETVSADQIADDVVLAKITNFNLGTARQLSKVLSELSHKSGLVIDLRGNPGGQLSEAVAVVELFVADGVIVSYQKVNADAVIFRAGTGKTIQSPLVVLIDRDSASAAEIVAGALQDRNRAVVIGERSMGKGTVQEFITLNDGSKLELTVAKYRTPSGQVIDGVGIEPDLAATDEEIAKRALQVLGGLATLKSKSS
jgi:carboxyl-terminal processing protease